MSNGSHSTTITRFFCGCLYRTPTDQAVFCPEHRGFITGRETIRHPESGPPPLRGLARSRHTGWAETLMSDERNSIHVAQTVRDPRGEEWSMTEYEETGICCACFIESDGTVRDETGIAMCECGNSDCSYRWCGRLSGLHAFWRLHLQGRCQEATGISDEEIFAWGPCVAMSEEQQEVLKQEREEIRREAERMVVSTIRAQTASPPRRERPHPVFLSRWLEPECREILNPGNEGDLRGARRSLERKVTRLHVVGAMPPQRTGEGTKPRLL